MAASARPGSVAASAVESVKPATASGPVSLDLSDNPRIPILMGMVADLSRARDPKQVLRIFGEGMTKLNGPRGYVSLSTRGMKPGEYKITRLIAGDLTEEIGNANPWRDWETLPVRRGGLLGRIVRQVSPAVMHRLDLRGDPVVGDALARYRSLMAIPLFDDGEPLNWSIVLREDPEGFTMEELEESILRTNLGGATVKYVRVLEQLREAHAAIRQEVEQIAKIQQALLPASVPDIPGLEIGVSYKTFDQAGGDMYALRPLRPIDADRLIGEGCCEETGPWAILIADVSGHGPAAAVVMAMMQSILETYPREPAGPAEVLEYANHHLCAKRIESRFVTAFLAIYDPRTRRLTYSRAGHNPPIWMKRAAGEGAGWDMAHLEDGGGVPLGIMEGVSYDETAVTLSPGQTLVLYTDGITEAMSPEGRMFGIEGIEGSLTECTGEPQCVISHVTTRLMEHQNGVRPRDDQMLLVIRVVEAGCG